MMKNIKKILGVSLITLGMFFASVFPSFAKPIGAGDFSVSASLSADRKTITYHIKTNTSEPVDFATIGFYMGLKNEEIGDELSSSYSNIEGDFECYDSAMAYSLACYFDYFKGSVTVTQKLAKPLPNDIQTVYYGVGNIDDDFHEATKDSYFAILNVSQSSFNLTGAGAKKNNNPQPVNTKETEAPKETESIKETKAQEIPKMTEATTETKSAEPTKVVETQTSTTETKEATTQKQTKETTTAETQQAETATNESTEKTLEETKEAVTVETENTKETKVSQEQSKEQTNPTEDLEDGVNEEAERKIPVLPITIACILLLGTVGFVVFRKHR